MSKQMELMAEERVVLGKDVRRLRRQGIIPANLYGRGRPSVALQVNAMALGKMLARGGNNVISLKVGNLPPVQALVKQVQRNCLTDRTTHVDFFLTAITEKLRTHVQLHFVNEASPASLLNATMLRSLDEVTVECLPADLPDSIEVDLSTLMDAGSVIRVGDLSVDPSVTIVTDHNEMVVGMHQQARIEKPETVDEKATVAAPTVPATSQP